MKYFIFILSIFLINLNLYAGKSHQQGRPVWNTTKNWDDNTEIQFRDWVMKNVKANLFNNPNNEFKGKLSVDCARATVAMRLLFAYQQGLRFVYLTESNFYDSENDTSSDFLSFAQKVVSSASTLTIQDNTFPVALKKGSINPGVIYLFQMPTGKGDAGRHAYMLKNITKAGVPHFIWATVPAKPRTLSERIEYPHFMVASSRWDNQWGFRRFYQPKDYETRAKLDELSRKARSVKNKGKRISEEEQGAYAKILLEIQATAMNAWASRGYDENIQNNVNQEILKRYQAQYTQYLQEQNLSFENVDFSNFNFKISNIDRKKTDLYPALPIVTHIEVESTKEKVVASIGESAKNKTQVSLLKIYHHMITHLLNSGLPEEANHTMQRYYKNLCFYIRERNVMIEEGYNYFFKSLNASLNGKSVPIMRAANEFNKCLSQNSEETYAYSTINRDEDMRAFLADAKKWYTNNRDKILNKNYQLAPYFEVIFQDKPEPILFDSKFAQRIKSASNSLDEQKKKDESDKIKKLNEKLVEDIQTLILKSPLSLDESDLCAYTVDYHNGKSEILYPWEIRKRFETKNLVSPWPWVSIERRWGKKVPTQGELSREDHPICDTHTTVKAKESALD